MKVDSTKMDSTSTSSPSTMPAPAAPAPAAANQASGPDFSGVVFGNYQYLTGSAAKGKNTFNFERAYLTAKEKLSDRTSVRITTDVFANANNGYNVRLKYGYLQYDYLKGADWNAVARIGMLHTVYIDHEENFWPRWLAKTPTEIAGFFASADLGAATVISLPSKMGEVYATITNGQGYTVTADSDRYKDYAARFTLTPFGSGSGLLSTFDLSGWYYKGALTNSFTTGALDKNRWGFFAGIRDPRLTVGVDWAERKDEKATSATASVDTTGRVLAAYVVARPMQWIGGGSTSPLGVVLRYDEIKPSTSNALNYALWIAGLTWDLSKKASVSLDYQEQDVRDGTAASPTKYLSTPRAVYMHVLVNY